MTQYLLAVHTVEGVAEPSPEEMAQMYKEVDAFNDELKAMGAWVFAGGLHPADTATVVRVSDGDVLTTDAPFADSYDAALALVTNTAERRFLEERRRSLLESAG